jgi:hypothetical protein
MPAWFQFRHDPPWLKYLEERVLDRPLEWGMPSNRPREVKPTLAAVMRDLSILLAAARQLEEPLYVFGDDAKDYFNQLAMASEEWWKFGVVFLHADDLAAPRSASERLFFVSERRIGFGASPSSNIAPRFSEEALAVLGRKKNLRLMVAKEGLQADALQEVRSVIGGVLLQDTNRTLGKVEEFRVVTRRAPSPEEMASLLFGWKVCKHVKSNAIVYCQGERTLGVGAGQMARVDSSRIAVWKAGEAGLTLRGSVVASEALFPFPDGLMAAADAGATAAIQPGGALRDAEVIAAADARGMAMVFTNCRHFKH